MKDKIMNQLPLKFETVDLLAMHRSCQTWARPLQLCGQSRDNVFVVPCLEQSIEHILPSLGK